MIIKMKDKGYTVLEHSFSTHTYTHKKKSKYIQNTNFTVGSLINKSPISILKSSWGRETKNYWQSKTQHLRSAYLILYHNDFSHNPNIIPLSNRLQDCL